MNFKQQLIIGIVVALSIFGLLSFSQKQIFALEIVNPLSGSATSAIQPEILYGRILKTALGLIGILSLVFFIWGGFLFLTSGGNQEKVKEGIDTLLWSVLGLAAIFGSYAILNIVIEVLTKTTFQ